MHSVATWFPRVLLVEDSATRRMTVENWLQREGFPVRAAEDGSVAIRILKTVQPVERPELVISDINMPNMNGLELAEAIKTDHHLKDISFMLYTTSRADAGADAGPSLSREAAMDYLRGAIDFDKLEDSVMQRLRALRNLRKLALARELLTGSGAATR